MRKLLIILIFLPFILNATQRKRMELDPKSESALMEVIHQSDALRKSLYNKNDSIIPAEITKLKISVDKSAQVVDGRQTPHILKVLHTISQDLSNAQMAGGDTRTKFLESAFKQIVTLYQSYKLEASYKVFFCHVDRSVWLQESKKPENPFLKDTTCGRVVPF